MTHPIDVLTLLSLPGVGRETLRHVSGFLSRGPSSMEGLRGALEEVKRQYPGMLPADQESLQRARGLAEKAMEACRRLRIHILVPGSKDFPARLAAIPDPPFVLFAKGDVRLLNADLSVAVVGTREPTIFGRRAARRLGQFFARRGWVVVSGLARGCDAAAQSGCVDAGGKTVAVLAHGLDRVYPPENYALGERIGKEGGCLLSEYFPGTAPCEVFFVQRDRLQSGLSLGILFVETEMTGGTIHTLRYAGRQGRPIACLVHPPQYRGAIGTEGNRHYLESGEAFGIRQAHDLLIWEDIMRRGRKLVSRDLNDMLRPLLSDPALSCVDKSPQARRKEK